MSPMGLQLLIVISLIALGVQPTYCNIFFIYSYTPLDLMQRSS